MNSPHPSGRLLAASRPGTNNPHPSARLINPAPGGARGRTDQGVDYSNIRGNIVAVASGVITAIYQNLQGFGYTIIERLSTGQDVYYALETGGTPAGDYVGEQVAQGQAIATGRGTGVIEVGYWDAASGRTLAQATTGYTEGQVTQAGQQFANAISGAASGMGQSSSLAQLWIQAGGNPALANIMAAIAMAESGGRVDATNNNSNGTTDRGLWQINSSHSQFDPNRLLTDPLYNAQAAVSIEKAQGLSAWTTYTSGAYKQFLGQADLVQGYGGSRPGGGPLDSGGGGANPAVPQLLDNYMRLRDMPRSGGKPPGAFSWWWQSFTGNWNDLANTNLANTTNATPGG